MHNTLEKNNLFLTIGVTKRLKRQNRKSTISSSEDDRILLDKQLCWTKWIFHEFTVPKSTQKYLNISEKNC